MSKHSIQGNYIFIKPEHPSPELTNGRTVVYLTHEELDALYELVYTGVEYDDSLIVKDHYAHLAQVGLIAVSKFAPHYVVDETTESDTVIKLTPLGFLVADDLFSEPSVASDSITKVLPVTLHEEHWSVVRLVGATRRLASVEQDQINQFLFSAIGEWLTNNTTQLSPEAYAALETLIEGTDSPTQDLIDLVERPRKFVKE